MDEVLDFIKRRFPKDCNWTSGNCYYFAVILKARFGGTILYDVIDGHFVVLINGDVYDWTGSVRDSSDNNHAYYVWDAFEVYDSLQRSRIYRDCIQ